MNETIYLTTEVKFPLNTKSKIVHVTYEPIWNKFTPPFKWYTQWAYKIKEIKYEDCNKNKRSYSPKAFSQSMKSGDNSIQIQSVSINHSGKS